MFRIEPQGPDLPAATALYGAGEARCVTGRPAPIDKCYAGPVIGVVVAGRFDYRGRHGAARATPGTVLLGAAGEGFQCRHLDTEGNRRAVVALCPDLLAEVAGEGGQESDFAVSVVPPSRAAAPLYGAVRRAAAGRALDEEAVIDLAARALALGRRSRPVEPSRVERRGVLDVARHIDEAYAEPCGLAELAALGGFSRYHFIRLFRAVTGESPRQYVIGARLRAAADRLIDTAEPVTEIALDVGFNDLSHFNATFRQAFGRAPSQWRRSA
ncbi:MAG: helix-turn-helix transcriptional regulator [Caulobacter sp.]|nr:helix-turn-helix transcriptional regulator [Caulobacter sp.]